MVMMVCSAVILGVGLGQLFLGNSEAAIVCFIFAVYCLLLTVLEYVMGISKELQEVKELLKQFRKRIN
jgi:hypothetical protein